MTYTEPKIKERGADFSKDRLYRYALWRIWDGSKPIINFLMLNGSIADKDKNDPTVERQQRRAVMWGYGGIYVTNIFGLVSTDPKALYKAADPIGPNNDNAILAYASCAHTVVLGWGSHGVLHGRGAQVAKLLEDHKIEAQCLGVTKTGHPTHPLYIPYYRKLVPYANCRLPIKVTGPAC